MSKNRVIILAVVLTLAVIGVGIARFRSSGDRAVSEMATFAVKRGPLTISVIESGTIKAREQVIIKSEVEGRTSILSLIPEGTRVKKGDLLVELDASQLVDYKIDQEIRVQNAEAAFIRARENLAVAKNQAQSDVDTAKLTLDFANQDLKKYLEGEYPNQLKQTESEITLRKEELQTAEEQLKWSQKLFERQYLSRTALQIDELSVKRKKLDLELAENNLNLLKNFTHQRKLAELKNDVKQAEMALERTIRKAKADVVQAEADLRAKQSEFKRQKDKLSKIEQQIAKTKIRAPADGLVIYATSARRGSWRRSVEPLAEGQDVRERQELIYLPTATSVKAEVDIHESSLKKISVGLPARITVDALPGMSFTGKVARIAPLPDAQSMWMNPDLKVYNTDVYLDGNNSALRTGMSCRVEIIIEHYQDATYVPVQAVLRVKGTPTVYVVNGESYEPRKVEIGLDNNRMVRIVKGLEPGEVVLLTPPLQAAAVEPGAIRIDEGGIYVERDTDSQKSANDRGAEQRLTGRREKNDRGSKMSDRKVPKPDRSQGRERRRRDMSPEEIKKVRERYQNMSPEEREKMRQERRKRRQQTRGDQ